MRSRACLLAALFALTACAKHDDSVMQGYGEADYIYLASQETGVVSALDVVEGQNVTPGQRVFKLDPDRLSLSALSAAETQEAQANAVRAAEAQARLTENNFRRTSDLYAQGFQSRAALDSDRAARDAALANLAQARRQMRATGAESGLAQVRVGDLDGEAPKAGRIERIFHRTGEVVAAGSPIASLLAPENMKVRFFAPEALIAQLAPGVRVRFACDGCAANLTGRVIRVATEPQFTPPVIYSLDQREKLVFLVDARPDRPNAIRPGLPVDVRIAR